jgi:glycosyltransferase involved in cell wall biosynthesis
MQYRPEVSIILPCRNEQEAIAICIKRIKEVLLNSKINAEIIISDSSSDASRERVRAEGDVVLVEHNKEGYGNAYLEGFKHARGKYIFMADADGTYSFNEIPRFIFYLREGYDFVLGNRFGKKIKKGSMNFTHKHIGNPLLSGTLRLFFKTDIKDSHCGMRAISREALDRLKLRTTGMEFASEMVVKALKNKLRIKQLNIDYYPRIGKSKLKPMGDGWRHLRFLLIYSPKFLFFIPGLIFLILGFIGLGLFAFTDPKIFGRQYFVHPMFIFSLLSIVGYQLILFSAFAKSYAVNHLGDSSDFMNGLYRILTIEKGSLFGILLVLLGIIFYLIIVIRWFATGLGELNEIKNSIFVLTLITIGVQTVFSSFMLSILGIKER